MKKLYFLSFILVFAQSGFAQIWPEERADELFNSRDYYHAIPEYEKLLKLKNNTPFMYKIGLCYFYQKDYKQASSWFLKVKNQSDEWVDAILYNAQCLHFMGKYVEAKNEYLLFQEKGGVRPNLQIYIQSCDFALQHDSIHTRWIMDTSITHVDGLYVGGAWHHNKLVYSEPNHEHDNTKKTIYPNYRIQEVEGEVVNEKGEPLFHQFYTGGLCFSNDGKTVYFTRNESDDKFIPKKHYGKNNIGMNGVNTLGIYSATVEHNVWKNIVHLPFNSINHSCMHPSMSPDGNTLYFVSNRDGGWGGYDLYMVTKSGNDWGMPVNLGSKINSLDDEMFPFILNDTTLYFSSNGQIGYGGADIYVTYKKNGEWTVPVNLGLPVNSSYDDFGFLFKDLNKSGFFASNRYSLPGKDDIFSFSIKPDLIKGKGIVLDKLTLRPIPGAHVKIHTPDSIVEVIADENGTFTWDYFEHHKQYHIQFSADKYEPEAMDFEADTSITLHLDKKLEPHLEKNMVFTFNDIMFEYNKADLLEESKLILDRLAEVLLHSGARVELSAHTDSRGSDKYNLTLSQKRALSAVNYLISKGVGIDKAIGIGYGETRLKNQCDDGVKCSEEDHTINRRVEIRIIEVVDTP